MSAFTVSDKHISAMLQAMNTPQMYHGYVFSYWWEGEWKEIRDKQYLGQVLKNENYRSVNFRYDDNEETLPFTYQTPEKRYTPVEIIALCNCFNYQACETDNWKETKAYSIMQALRENAIQSLPGMNDAPWSI